MSDSWRSFCGKLVDAFVGRLPSSDEDVRCALEKEEPGVLKLQIFALLKGMLMGAVGLFALTGYHVPGHVVLGLYTSLGLLTYHGLIKSVRVDRMRALTSASTAASA